jgi:hypothetical protein
MDNYNVVGIYTVPHPKFGVLINIVSKEDIAYYVTIGNIPHAYARISRKSHLNLWGK